MSRKFSVNQNKNIVFFSLIVPARFVFRMNDCTNERDVRKKKQKKTETMV